MPFNTFSIVFVFLCGIIVCVQTTTMLPATTPSIRFLKGGVSYLPAPVTGQATALSLPVSFTKK